MMYKVQYLRIRIKNSKGFQTKQFKDNLWENTNIQKKHSKTNFETCNGHGI